MKRCFFKVLTLVFLAAALISCKPREMKLLAGTYADKGSKGVYLLDVNPSKGIFKILSDADAGPNPSYYCISPSGRFIYAANEVMNFTADSTGGITTLEYDKATSALKKTAELPVPFGGPCFISLSPSGNYLLLVNYSSSSVSVVKLDAKGIPSAITDTILFKPDGERVSHPHMISFDPSGRKVYLTDLGFDRIMIYDFDEQTGKLIQKADGTFNFPQGTGPRHFVFNAAGNILYVICELNSTISVFNVAADGSLSQLQTLSTLGEDFTGKSFCADIHLGKDGRFLYGSNRGENTIVVFSVDADGKLEVAGRTPCGGDWPRNFVIDPDGRYLITGNQRSGSISLFRIDKNSGIPSFIGDQTIKAPACLKILTAE